MSLTPDQQLALTLDPSLLFSARGLTPDPWQYELLRSPAPRILLNCCRQAGKSTTVAALALHPILFQPHSLVLLVSRSLRQSSELFRKVLGFYRALGRPVPAAAETTLCLELAHGGRVISLPGDEDTVRGYSGPNLVVIDEAARVPDDLYRAIRPMLAVSGGRLICLSTPNGARGFFYHAWMDQASDWLRFEVPASQVPRISQEHLDRELRSCGETWYNQEYECRFEAREGLVYPDMPGCVVDTLPPEIAQTSSEHLARRLCSGRLIGGIDFGFSDPTAAVWGLHDKPGDILWIVGEFYAHKQTLDQLAKVLPRTVLWNADPSAALEIRELHRADFKIRPADNSVEPGIMAVTSRIESGRLKILRSACPHLLEEAQLYHRDAETGKPVDKDNHVMDALRYLVSRLDHGFLARVRRTPSESPPRSGRPWLSIWNEQLWTPLNY